jgi:integrase
LKNKVLGEIGEVRLSRLDYNRIEQWVRELRDSDRAVATIKSRLSCLHFALRLAVKKGWMDTVPPMPDLEQSARKLRYLRDDPDEERMLLRCCPVLGPDASRVMSLAIVFLLDTGCRLSELLKVRWGSISEIRGTTYVLFEDRKAGDNLRLPLTSRAREAIEALLEDRYWMRRVRGADLDDKRCRSAQNWMTHGFARVRDDARLPDVSLHTLRHTCASRLVQAGVNLYEVRKMLGHSSITVTERYSHLAPDGLAGVVSVLEARGLPRKVTSIKMRTPSQ